MRKTYSQPSGFTFIESLIAFSVIGILLLLTWGTVQFLLMHSSRQVLYTRAHFLAMEGIEIVRQIRHTAFQQNREKGFEESLGKKEGNYVLQASNQGFILTPGTHETIEMKEHPYIDYCRTIQISSPTKSNTLKRVDSIVRWGGVDCAQGEFKIQYSIYLANLKK